MQNLSFAFYQSVPSKWLLHIAEFINCCLRTCDCIMQISHVAFYKTDTAQCRVYNLLCTRLLLHNAELVNSFLYDLHSLSYYGYPRFNFYSRDQLFQVSLGLPLIFQGNTVKFLYLTRESPVLLIVWLLRNVVPRPKVTSILCTSSVTLFGVIQTLLSPSSYYKGFKRSIDD